MHSLYFSVAHASGPMTEPHSLVAWIVLLPLLSALILGGMVLLNPDKKPPTAVVSAVACLGPGLAALVSLILFGQLLGHPNAVYTQSLGSWLNTPIFELHFSFALDHLSGLLALMVTFIGTLIHIFSIAYMQSDRSYARYFAYLNLFTAAMLILILSDHIVGMFLGWEGVGVCSYLLIGFWFSDTAKASAGTKAFIANRVGDFGFLLGIFFIFYFLGHFEYSAMQGAFGKLTDPGYAATLITACLLVGALGKSAQIPLHVWLPDAMAGPTPVSALIHAATMVTAGVYMIARLHFLYSAAPAVSWVVLLIGALTALMAATIALVQSDIKKVLAYSTMSQLGYMFMAVGAGAYTAGVFHLFTHAFFKAALFLGAGAVIHCLHHEQSLAKMGGLKDKLKATRWVMLISTLAIAGIPPFAGFFSKDEILWSLWTHGHYVFWGIGLLTAALTSFYMFRLYYLAFEGPYRGEVEADPEPVLMKAPLWILAGGAVLTGFLGLPEPLGLPNWFSHWLSPVFGGHHAEGAASMAMILMAVSVGAAALGWFMAKQKFAQADTYPEPQDNALNRVLFAKYGFDAFYQKFLVQPLLKGGWFMWKITDELMIDGPIKMIPKVYMLVSMTTRAFQLGNIRVYGYYLIIGMAMMIYLYFSLHPGALFLS